MPKAAIHNPNWNSFGGGERYTAALVKLLLNKGWKVDIWWPEDVSKLIHDRFEIDISPANFIPTFKNYLLSTINYQLVFWVSNGSVPSSLAKKTIIHFQIPFHGQGANSILNKVKASLYTCVCNSGFTKEFIDKTYAVNSQVIYPPVNVDSISPAKKTNTIVSIARFSTLLHAKRQDTLIKAFSKIHKSLPDWELILAGGALDPEYVTSLKKQAKGLPVRIITNPSLSQIKSLLGRAKIFWSATGFEVNDKINPEKVEHFGITTVEAMAAEAVPIVTDSGGHKETVISGQTGYLWSSIDELISQTLNLANNHSELVKLGKLARERSKLFSTQVFNTKYSQLL